MNAFLAILLLSVVAFCQEDYDEGVIAAKSGLGYHDADGYPHAKDPKCEGNPESLWYSDRDVCYTVTLTGTIRSGGLVKQIKPLTTVWHYISGTNSISINNREFDSYPIACVINVKGSYSFKMQTQFDDHCVLLNLTENTTGRYHETFESSDGIIVNYSQRTF